MAKVLSETGLTKLIQLSKDEFLSQTDTTDCTMVQLATVATSGDYDDLSNKPTIPAAQVNSDWNASSGVAQILNKPTLATVATSGSYNDLSNKPSLSGYQTTSNLVTSVSASSTDAQYPSAKLFYDTCGDIETLINAL